MRRRGFTLIELMVVLAIIAILFGLLLAAVQKVRDAAAQLESTNHLRQINIGTHSYVETNGSYLPSINGINYATGKIENSVLFAILPFVEEGAIYNDYKATFGPGRGSDRYVIQLYLSPADPTAGSKTSGRTSYGANAVVFAPWSRFPFSIPDGPSNTIFFAEHYAVACGGDADFHWGRDDEVFVPPPYNPPNRVRRATFADKEMGDVYPVTQDAVSEPSIKGLTFQAGPTIAACDPRLAQTPHAAGMIVAMGDGSVRTLAAGISERTYWAAVTPGGAEVFGADWAD